MPRKLSKSAAENETEFSPTLVLTIFIDERMTSSPGERLTAKAVSEMQKIRESAYKKTNIFFIKIPPEQQKSL